MTRAGINIVTVAEQHREQWRAAYLQYAAFYKTSVSDEQLARLWHWLTQQPPQVFGLVAEDANANGEVVGVAHWRIHPRPLAANITAYLDDLFVFPAKRGGGVGGLLIADCARRAKELGCNRLRWATASDNITAQKLYDKIARRTDWVIYDLDIND